MKVYVYPWSTKTAPGRRNPYLRNFINSLEPYCDVVNRARPTSVGLFAVLPWLGRLDVLVLHWPANIADKRGAFAQSVLLRGLLLAKSFFGLRIVYVLHDRVSHAGTRWRWKTWLMRTVLSHADVVITHARDGVAFGREHCPACGDRVRYLPHPFETPPTLAAGTGPFERRRYDVLVWGTVVAYKGLSEFARLLKDRGLAQRYKVLIAGRFPDAAAAEALAAEAPGVTIQDRFVPDAELAALMADAKVILFPYRPESVLSSAALMKSLESDALIIGPDAGAFRDCAALGLSSTFNELSELDEAIDRALAADRESMVQRRKAFAAENTWQQFGRRLAEMLGGRGF